MPNPIPSWGESLSMVNRSMSAPASCEIWGYWFPEPALLVGPKDEARQLRYLTNWVRLRPVWLYLLRVPDSQPTRVSAQLWRDFLNGIHEVSSSTTRAGKRMAEIKRILGDVFNDGQFDLETLGPVYWHGSRIDNVGGDLAPAILWELFELSFRYELLALDRYLRPSESRSRPEEARREDLLAKVFPGHWLRAVNSLPSVDSPGLFAELPQRRVSALNALRDVLLRWPGCPSTITSAAPLQNNDSTDTIVCMERELSWFYVNTFFSYSARAPLIPHLYPH